MKKILIMIFAILVTSIFAEDIWEDGFEELTGWSLNGEFQIDSPQGLGGEYGNPDPTSAYAGSNVLGVDGSSNEPIAFAPIMSQYGNTMSDIEGYFFLDDIPVGNREIVIAALGYIPFTQNEILVTENDTIYVLCELVPDPDTPPSPQNPQASVYDGNNVHLTWEEPELPSEELLAYNVYRNGIILVSIIEEEYYDLALINGLYSYYISAVYDSGESLPTETVNAQINVSGSENNVIQQSEYNLTNYPNPFNPTTNIMFNLPLEFSESAELKIYNLKGQKIRQYSISQNDQILNQRSSIIWNGTDHNGNFVSSGIYFYQLVIDGNVSAKNKMILLK